MSKRYTMDEAEAKLHLAVGVAIHTWQSVEHQLEQVFVHAADLAPIEVQAMFVQIQSFPLKVGLTDVAVRTSFAKDDEWTAKWTQICDYLRELSGDRNFIAHNGMVSHTYGPGKSLYKIGMGNNKRPPLDEDAIWDLVEYFHHAQIVLLIVESCVRNGTSSRDKHRGLAVRLRPSRSERQATARQERQRQRRSSQAPAPATPSSLGESDIGKWLEEAHQRYVSRPSSLKE